MMTRRLRAAGPLALLLCAVAAPAQEPPADLPAHVRAVFAAKCSQCHGPDLPKPKGKFGYVTDLQRLAGNPELVVPSKPEESHLWELVEEGKMPPRSAKAGPLSAAEKALIHDWIATGAPASAAIPSAPAAPLDRVPPESPPPSLLMRLLSWLGKQHVRIIHYPIALLTAAAAAEAWLAVRGRRQPWPPVRFGVLLGAATAVCAAGLGWLLADVTGYGQHSPQLLLLHRTLGTTAAGWSIGVAVLSERDARRGVRGWTFRVALWAGAALVVSAAHFGGSLVYGEDFFAW